VTPIYLDIETLQQDPYDWMIRDDADLRPPKNYKDPEKIATWRAEAAASQVADLRERSSLDPLVGGIVACVGVAVGDADPVVLVNTTSDEEGERALLAKLAAGLTKGDRAGMPLVSWNGAFDWRYLAIRALRHGVYQLSARAKPAKPWGDRLHCDPSEGWRLGSRDCLWRLADVARYLGVEVDDTISGAQVAQAWGTESGRQAVIDHCRADVVRLREVTARLVAAGLVDLEVTERDLPVPPPRGSVADLAPRCHRQQLSRDPGQCQTAATAAELPSPPDLQTLHTLPSDTLRAYLVALGGRP
jgi:hypothetical protein